MTVRRTLTRRVDIRRRRFDARYRRGSARYSSIHPWALVWGSIPVAITLIAWFWPKSREAEEELALEKVDESLLLEKA